MLIVMRKDATEADIAAVNHVVEEMGYTPQPVPGIQRINICVLGNKTRVDSSYIEMMPGVEEVIHVTKPYKLVSRVSKARTVVTVGGNRFGGEGLPVIAGPCAVEGRAKFIEAAHMVKDAGATMLRGGAFKPRTSPYAFQGLGEEGLKILAEARDRTGLPVCTEVMDIASLPLVSEYSDVVQIGARNMHNFSLLREAGRQPKPVLLKRGFAATITELLMAAEYVVSEGNWNVILCERGIRTFEQNTRFTLDLSAIPVIHEFSHLPVIVDPSHASGRWNAVPHLARAAVAVGADGLMVEVHQNPAEALSDGPQSLKPDTFAELMKSLDGIFELSGRNA
ncbi:MAG: 3-deoxy-7-phosphoheptulonate synthase [Candidatus Latescibacteria bacterium]|nr:3-deoxy-7-phosphoheptulonate synthase [Candidatus Latescibacterota bacterium]